jgi:UDP-N-acetylenolpyruvoylglucosamine reductase
MTSYQPVDVSAGFQAIVDDGYVSHQPLSEIMPTRIGGVARHFIRASQIDQIVESLKLAISNRVPYRIIGSGTATLVGESGFPGLIIKNSTKNIFSLSESSRVSCDSGVENSHLVNQLASRGLGGIEFLSVIPGSVGSAVVTNARSLGRQTVSYVRSVNIFDPDTKKVVAIGQDEIIKPGFQKMFNQELVFPPVILTVTLQLAALTQEEIIRRLGLVKSYLPRTTDRVLSHIFSEEPPKEMFDKELLTTLKQLKVSYDQKSGYLLVKREATPKQVRTAVDAIIQRAREFGVEEDERLTYLGYFSEEAVA